MTTFFMFWSYFTNSKSSSEESLSVNAPKPPICYGLFIVYPSEIVEICVCYVFLFFSEDLLFCGMISKVSLILYYYPS